MTTIGPARLHILGKRIAEMLSSGELTEIHELMECYLAGLASEFHQLPPHAELNIEQQGVIRQFKVLLAQVEREKTRIESALFDLARAGRVAKLYKNYTG